MFDIILLVHVITGQGTIGEIYVVENGNPFYFKDGNVLWFKTLKFVVPKFLRFILMAFVENLKRLSHGAAYNALPIEKLKNHLIYFPQSLDVQESIVNKS